MTRNIWMQIYARQEALLPVFSRFALQLICINRFLVYTCLDSEYFYWQKTWFLLLLTFDSTPATDASGNGYAFSLNWILTNSSNSWTWKLISRGRCQKCNQRSTNISQTGRKYSATAAKHQFYACKFLHFSFPQHSPKILFFQTTSTEFSSIVSQPVTTISTSIPLSVSTTANSNDQLKVLSLHGQKSNCKY